jgi:hypothetical protein
VSKFARFVAIVFILVCAVGYQLVIHYEPQGPQSCDYVQVIGVSRCGRGGQCFVVRYVGTSSQRLVGTFAPRPFSVNYIGPAALFTRRGEWTGAYHFEMKESCSSPFEIR